MSNVVELRQPARRGGKGLGLLQRRTLRFVSAHIKLHGGWPSYAEIRKGLDLKSDAGVVRTLEALFERGFLTRPQP